jgi:density-regulated protein
MFFPEILGVKLSDASKKLGKKFATGASVVKVSAIFCDSVLAFDSFEALSRHIYFVPQGPTEKEQIDVQGDISYDIVEFLTDTWHDVIVYKLCFFCY